MRVPGLRDLVRAAISLLVHKLHQPATSSQKGLSQSAEREFGGPPICSDCVILDLFTSVGLQHIARKRFEYDFVTTATVWNWKFKNIAKKGPGVFFFFKVAASVILECH